MIEKRKAGAPIDRDIDSRFRASKDFKQYGLSEYQAEYHEIIADGADLYRTGGIDYSVR